MKIVQTLVRKLYPHGAVRTVLRGPLKGLRFVAVPGMAGTFAMGMDRMNMAFLSSQIHPGEVVYDVGGNCGQMALFFSRTTGASGKVYTFEPVPQNAALLRRNLVLNKIENVELTEVAVAADSNPQTFCFDAIDHTMGTLQTAMTSPDAWKTTFEVQCLTLDSFLAKGARAPGVLKIDVEGSGLGVVEGARHLIETHRPRIYFEIHASDENSPELKAARMLQDRWGYQIKDLSGKMKEGLRPVWGEAVWCTPPARGS